MQVPPLSEAWLYPKEKTLINLVAAERMVQTGLEPVHVPSSVRPFRKVRITVRGETLSILRSVHRHLFLETQVSKRLFQLQLEAL